MSDLPDPLTPPECDLRGFDWMALCGFRLFKSTFYRKAKKDPRGGLAGIKLWWEAMFQKPAGSLPNDEEELCDLADFGEDMKTWKKHREVAMHGWVLCSDGRLYHPVVAEQVVDAWEKKRKAKDKRDTDAERLRRWRAAQRGGDNGPGNGLRNADETHFDTPDETHRETPYETRKTVQDQTRPDQTVQKNSPLAPHVVGGTRGAGTNPRAMGTNPRGYAPHSRQRSPNIRNPVVADMLEAEQNQAVIYDLSDYAWYDPEPNRSTECLPSLKSSEAG